MKQVQTDQTEGTTRVPLGDLNTHTGLQPRNMALLSHKEQARQEDQQKEHVRCMVAFLRGAPREDLRAIEVADVGGVLYVVDGHHRLHAYQAAKRESIPANVRAMTLREASAASKLANLGGTQMEMRAAQRREAVWQYLWHATEGATVGLPHNVTQRGLEARFGVKRDTIANMLDRLPKVYPEQFDADKRDPITGFPRWKEVSTTRGDMLRAMAPDVRQKWREDVFLRRLERLLEGTDGETVRGALRRWERDDEAAEELRGTLDPVEF